MSGIRISKEYGVNPSVQVCPCCGKDMGVLLLGTAYKDENGKTARAPMHMAIPELCDDCKKVISNGGVFFIEVRDGEAEKNSKNPYRTGRLIAVHKEWVDKHFKDARSINYMEQSVFEPIFGEALREVKA